MSTSSSLYVAPIVCFNCTGNFIWFVKLSKVVTKVLKMKKIELIKIKRIEWTSELFGGEIVNYGYNLDILSVIQTLQNFNCAQ